MNAAGRGLDRIEFILLCLFAVALPLVEAPKNVFWALFVLVWLARSARMRDFGGPFRGWDAIFAALVAAPLISELNTAYTPQWREMGDVVGYVSLGWILSRSRLDASQLRGLALCLIGATLLGVAHGFWVLATDSKRVWLQLNSVGHVNHSALYGAGIGVLAVVLACVAARGRARVIATVAAMLMLGAMIAFASRGALVAYLAGVLPALLWLSGARPMRVASILVLALALGAGAQWLTREISQDKNGQTLVKKTLDGIEQGNLSSFRLQAFHTAIEMVRQYPLSGTGAANFRAVSPADVERWVTARGEPYDPKAYFFADHAHGLYANTLGERGLIGILALALLAGGWTFALIRRRPRPTAKIAIRLCWGAGIAGWVVVFVGGLFNTTLHHEHGMLAMVFLGLLLAGVPPRPEPAA